MHCLEDRIRFILRMGEIKLPSSHVYYMPFPCIHEGILLFDQVGPASLGISQHGVSLH